VKNFNSADGGARVSEASKPDHRPLNAALNLCIRKTRGNIRRLADEPKSAAWAVDGNFFDFQEGFFEIGNWTSSFFTGMALIAWRETEDEYFLNHVLRLAPSYRKKVFERHLDTHHDLGFLYSLYSVALYKLTGSREHREVGLRAAEVLSQRFNEKGNFIRAWGRMDTPEFDNMAIIDCLMNLPFAPLGRRMNPVTPRYPADRRRATPTWRWNTFIREDDSVRHAFRFDLQTGGPAGGLTMLCGHFQRIHYWARGARPGRFTGWPRAHSHTRDRKIPGCRGCGWPGKFICATG
jgi:unsaturated chondroitin disaccharide hydrolase